jgi:hypothetical protein
MKKFILFLIIILLTINCYAYTVSDIQQYLYKKVVIVYKNDNNHLAVAVGKILIIAKPRDDHTIDDYYSYLILETRTSLEIIKIYKIDNIRLYEDIIKR